MHLVNIKLEDALTLLYPFTETEMASIMFKRLEGSAAKPVFITRDMVKYLSQICFHTLVLAQSDIIGYEQHSLLTYKYPQCLEYLAFSGNRFSLSYNSHLIELLILAKKAANSKFFDISYNAVNFNNVRYCNIEALKNYSYRNEIYHNGCEVQSTDPSQYSNAYSNEDFLYSKMADGSNTTITLPDNLTFFRCLHYMTSYIEYGVNMFVRHSDSLRKVLEHRLEKKFKYDIYLAYANDKIQWAREFLLPRIECSWNMTVCIEDRDFSVGMAKADAIANAVAESKHAIFIISEIYQHDAWSKYEIERIEYEKCSNYIQKIVVIAKDESISCIPNELKNLLQHLTVIQWTDDETAWDKLCMALFTESY
ncbi:unnamed protein product [Mytilus edulis]|uniref:TIR domain-containing protein n=1 Tax=Mytilus edulis TaxID=6550 RepID=A0A8S3UID3_MYTED|nr:unnamed protein product [Mytilus edulis]